jgi:protein-disulfide isomerase
LAYRIEQDDTREELAERYVARFGAASRPTINVDNAPILGEKAAAVTLVVFSDFQCPHCANAAKSLRTIVEESNGRVRMAYRNFPLSRQKTSMYLAVTGLAAHRQGKFWQMHDALYENRTRLNPDVIEGLADEVGMDVEQFQDDLLDPALEAQVRADQEAGVKLGVRGTPAIFINGRRHDEPINRLKIAVEEEILRTKVNQPAETTSETVSPESASGDGGADGT